MIQFIFFINQIYSTEAKSYQTIHQTLAQREKEADSIHAT